jgi:hypothetical protein
MGWLDTLRSWFSRDDDDDVDEREDEDGGFDVEKFVYVKIPGDIDPLARGERFEDPISAMLAARGLGEVSGGGSSLSAPDASGRSVIEYCGLDVDAADRDAALAALRELLPTLAAPVGTELQYTRAGARRRDIREAGGWTLDVPRTDLHPGFGV